MSELLTDPPYHPSGPELKFRPSIRIRGGISYMQLSPVPTDVNFTIETGRGTNSRVTKASAGPVPLVPEPKSDDPAGAARFASKPGPYHLLGVRGTLSATINGRVTSFSFSESR
jgi:hypothetical protein